MNETIEKDVVTALRDRQKPVHTVHAAPVLMRRVTAEDIIRAYDVQHDGRPRLETPARFKIGDAVIVRQGNEVRGGVVMSLGTAGHTWAYEVGLVSFDGMHEPGFIGVDEANLEPV